MKNDFLSTLFVGIDVSSKDNVFCALDYSGSILFSLDKPNNQPGSQDVVDVYKRQPLVVSSWSISLGSRVHAFRLLVDSYCEGVDAKVFRALIS